MEVKGKWKYHVVLGVLALLLGYLTDYGAGGKAAFMAIFDPKGMPFTVSFYLTCVIIYFINFKFVSPLLLTKRKNMFFFFLAIIFLSILFALIRYFFDEIILFKILGYHNYYGLALKIKYYIFDNFYFAIKPILFSTIIYLVFRSIDTRSEMNQLKLDQKNAEYEFLKSQISPHFLFNTLNTFYTELILSQPETAKGIHKLSELLRYVTYDSKQNFVPLAEEIKFINDYIYFYKKRYEDELQVRFEVVGDVSNQKVPSLVLIHFIENLFKHGIVNDSNHPAIIRIEVDHSRLELTTKNRIQTSEKYSDSGIGKENINRRLTSIFGNDFSVNYSEEKSIFTTKLILPLR